MSTTSLFDVSVYALKGQVSKADEHTWHCRLGHLGIDNILRMARKGMVKGMALVKRGARQMICKLCLKGKQARKVIPKKSDVENPRVLHRVYSDICGPMQMQMRSSHQYFVTHIDGKAHYTDVQLLKTKAETFAVFKTYKAHAEVQTGRRMNYFRSDGGSEYESQEFEDFLCQNGIHHEKTNAYSPQENGVAEQMNRTLVEMARSMLCNADLPLSYWGDTILYATHIVNRISTRALPDNITPFEAFTRNKPNAAHLRIFSCKAYVHIPDEKHRKLDLKSLECTFLGYAKHRKAYCLVHHSSEHFFESRNVIFDEDSILSYVSLQEHSDSDNEDEGDEQEPRQPSSPLDFVNSTRLPAPTVGLNEPKTQASIAAPALQDIEPHKVPGTAAAAPEAPSLLEASEPEAEEPPAPCRRRNCRYITGDPPRRSERIQHRHDEAERVQNEKEVNELLQTNTEDSDDEPTPTPSEPEATGDQDAGEQARTAQHAASLDEAPLTYEEAMSRPDAAQWKLACIAEMEAFVKAKLFDAVLKPDARKVVDCKWVFVIKRRPNGEIVKYKAQLVAHGFTQIEGMDYTETFSPISKFTSICALLAFAAQHDMEVHQMDVKLAFLNGDLDKEIYMNWPPGFDLDDEIVWRLHKSLYSLKQASCKWYKHLQAELEILGYKCSSYDHGVFYKVDDKGQLLIITVYVDNILLISKSQEVINEAKEKLSNIFKMTDLGEVHWIINMEILRECGSRTLTVLQRQYAKHILCLYSMEDCRPVTTPMESNLKLEKLAALEDDVDVKKYQRMLESLMYLMLRTRPDLAYAVETLSHYVDADWAADINDHHSITGYVFTLAEGAISWQSKKQHSTALSSMEAKYMAASNATKEATWLREFLAELKVMKDDFSVPLLIDNQSAIALVKNAEFHECTKHIGVRYHFIHEQYKHGEIDLEYCPTGDQVADAMTKGLARKKLERFVDGMGLVYHVR
ncbi:hypothetical protein NM688_g1664 [Phlebia brevispora]|uniref:Uncharacterized protein n=1 Tax=Phlebia brevispora TaxID=194682 RepID=A0ACC1TAP8_9APHY|nr:hypothetical protein NM688_g1664 [Phlebia brevispora]